MIHYLFNIYSIEYNNNLSSRYVLEYFEYLTFIKYMILSMYIVQYTYIN